jgi:hypothetical protein
MIIDPRIEPPTVFEFDTQAYQKYIYTVNIAGTLDDFYKFITVPSPKRERFILSLTETVYKADNHSIIVRLS